MKTGQAELIREIRRASAGGGIGDRLHSVGIIEMRAKARGALWTPSDIRLWKFYLMKQF